MLIKVCTIVNKKGVQVYKFLVSSAVKTVRQTAYVLDDLLQSFRILVGVLKGVQEETWNNT